MSEFDFLSKSRKLLRQLNWYLLHIAMYLVASMSIVLFIYRSPASRWPWFFLILLWTVAVIIHGLHINNVNIFKGKNTVILKGLMRINGGY